MKLKRFTDFLFENYGKNILNKFTNPIYAYIHGLYRNSVPFKGTNIQTLSDDELTELFTTWKDNFIEVLEKDCLNNKTRVELILELIDYYIDNIMLINQSSKNIIVSKFSVLLTVLMKHYETVKDTLCGELLIKVFNQNKEDLKFENLFDFLNKHNLIKQDNYLSETSITNPDTNDIVFQDTDLLIVNGSTQKKCIQYGKGYPWCISSIGINYFNNYRVNHNGVIYFVLDKTLPIEDNKRLCVVLVYLIENHETKIQTIEYGVADKTNSGDMSGGPKKAHPDFNFVEDNVPILKNKGLQKYFVNDGKLSDDEKKYHKLISKEYIGDNISEYIIELSKEIIFNDNKILPQDMFKDYIINRKLTFNQFKNILSNTEFLETYVELRFKSITSEQYDLLNSNLKNRYLKKCSNEQHITSLEYIHNISLENAITLYKNYPLIIFRFNKDIQEQLEMYIPDIEKRSFYCDNCNLTNLKYMSKIVEGDFICINNKLTNLEGSPHTVGKHFKCYSNKLNSLYGAPITIGGNFDCRYNPDLPKEEILKYKDTGAVKGKIISDYGEF